jgi:hypothetical protein
MAVEVKPAGSLLKISRNGALVAERTLTGRSTKVELNPGVYTFELTLAGYRTLVQTVAVGPDQPRQWQATLAESLGTLRVAQAEGQNIAILNRAGQPVNAGEPQLKEGYRVYALPVGDYDIMITKADHEAASQPVTIVEDVASDVQVELKPMPGSLRIVSELPAELWQGTRRLGDTGAWIRQLPAGPLEVQVRRTGYREARLTLDIPPNGERELTPPALVPESATLTVQMQVRGRTVAAEHQPRRGFVCAWAPTTRRRWSCRGGGRRACFSRICP